MIDGKSLVNMSIHTLEKKVTTEAAIKIDSALLALSEKKLQSFVHNQNNNFVEAGSVPQIEALLQKDVDSPAETADEAVHKNFPGCVSVINGEKVYQSNKPFRKQPELEQAVFEVPDISMNDMFAISAFADNMDHINKCLSLWNEKALSKLKSFVFILLYTLRKLPRYNGSYLALPFSGDITRFKVGCKYKWPEFCLYHKEDYKLKGNRIVVTGPFVGYDINPFDKGSITITTVQ